MTWNKLEPGEQKTLLEMMSARLGSCDEPTLPGLECRGGPASKSTPGGGIPYRSFAHGSGRPEAVGRVFFPCRADPKNGCVDQLFLGAKPGEPREVDGFEIYDVQLLSTAPRGRGRSPETDKEATPRRMSGLFGEVGRRGPEVHMGYPLAIYDRTSDRHVYVGCGQSGVRERSRKGAKRRWLGGVQGPGRRQVIPVA